MLTVIAMRTSSSFLLALLTAAARAHAQAPANAYPVKPVPLADSVEIALAMSAAPAELSALIPARRAAGVDPKSALGD